MAPQSVAGVVGCLLVLTVGGCLLPLVGAVAYISGSVWCDSNYDGILGVGENFVAAAVVNVQCFSTSGQRSTTFDGQEPCTADENGEYWCQVGSEDEYSSDDPFDYCTISVAPNPLRNNPCAGVSRGCSALKLPTALQPDQSLNLQPLCLVPPVDPHPNPTTDPDPTLYVAPATYPDPTNAGQDAYGDPISIDPIQSRRRASPPPKKKKPAPFRLKPKPWHPPPKKQSAPRAHASSKQLAFIASGYRTVSICSNIDKLTGCTVSSGGKKFSSPSGISFFGGRAYVTSADPTSRVVTICNDFRRLGNCYTSDGDKTFRWTTGITFYKNKAYVANVDSISICSDAANLRKCRKTVGDNKINGPWAISFYRDRAYITEPGLNSITVCENGEKLTKCRRQWGQRLFQAPYFLSFWGNQAFVGNTRVGFNKVTVCRDASRLLQCETLSGDGAPFTIPTFVAFMNDKGYVVNMASNAVSICSQASSLTGCVVSTAESTLKSPTFITFLPPSLAN